MSRIGSSRYDTSQIREREILDPSLRRREDHLGIDRVGCRDRLHNTPVFHSSIFLRLASSFFSVFEMRISNSQSFLLPLFPSPSSFSSHLISIIVNNYLQNYTSSSFKRFNLVLQPKCIVCTQKFVYTFTYCKFFILLYGFSSIRTIFCIQYLPSLPLLDDFYFSVRSNYVNRVPFPTI